MTTYTDHIKTLDLIRYTYALTEGEEESMLAGIEALKTLQDMGTYMQSILNNRYKGEDNKPWRNTIK